MAFRDIEPAQILFSGMNLVQIRNDPNIIIFYQSEMALISSARILQGRIGIIFGFALICNATVHLSDFLDVPVIVIACLLRKETDVIC